MKQTELEKKTLLSEQEYHLLRELLFTDELPRKQRNFYFDTNDGFFRKRNITVRVREKNGRYLGTIKTHTGGDSDCSIEETFHVHEIPKQFEYEGFRLFLQGELVTERLEVDLENQLILTLDCNQYLGKTDYELELEYLSNRHAEAEGIVILLQKILKRDRPFERSLSKSNRFFLQKDQKKMWRTETDMFRLKDTELNQLLSGLREIRQIAGGLTAMLEHLIQLQTKSRSQESTYNPDEYLEHLFQQKNNQEKGEKEDGRL